MIRTVLGASNKVISAGARAVLIGGKQHSRSASRSLSTETDEWFLFPRQEEGNVYMHNWSMVEDGVVPVGKAFRNARIPVITNALGVKTSTSKIPLAKPIYSGEFSLQESGDTMSHTEFAQLISKQQQFLSSGHDLYVEDAALGVHATVRQGARVISDDPAVALIARTLLAPTPARPLDHRARFKGWNFDPRWKLQAEWKGDRYEFPEEQVAVALPGQRPLVAFVGGPGDAVAVQFVENNEEIVGANVVVGGAAPVAGVIAGLGHAATVLINEQCPHALALPCACVGKGAVSAIIIGADDELIAQAAGAGMLFGAYHNVLTAEGVSAMWNGYIASSGTTSTLSTPLVEVDGKLAVALSPDNLAHVPKHVIFYEKGASKSKLSADEAVKRIVQLTDESKEAIAKEFLKTTSVSIAGSAKDVNSLF